MDTAPFTLEITQDAPAVFHAPSCWGSLDLRLGDCMDGMKTFPDGYFDLAVVDPPYGLGDKLTSGGGSKGWGMRVNSGAEKWDVAPPHEYFQELRRVSKHQIVWGGNYFDLPPSRGVIAWDKKKDHDRNSSHWELAWTSFDCIARIFRFCNNGGFVAKEPKIHPTQKPVELYAWTLATYAKPGMRVLDTHMGSGSIAIAAHYAGVHLTAYEIDADYFHAAKARIARETSQAELFSPQNASDHPTASD